MSLKLIGNPSVLVFILGSHKCKCVVCKHLQDMYNIHNKTRATTKQTSRRERGYPRTRGTRARKVDFRYLLSHR